MGVGFRLSRRSHPLNFIQSEKMLLKAVLLCHLLLTPLVFSFNIPSQFKDYGTEIEARQFSDEPLINYGIWGFIAGLSDYFIRNALTATTTTTASTRRRNKKNKNKRNKNKNKNNKGKKADRDGEVSDSVADDAPMKKDEPEPVVDAVDVADVAIDTVVDETVEA